ncbi:MAG TPA: hypothetical protein V6D29_21675 [Leptolyngbyaceae cyanobacterium]
MNELNDLPHDGIEMGNQIAEAAFWPNSEIALWLKNILSDRDDVSFEVQDDGALKVFHKLPHGPQGELLIRDNSHPTFKATFLTFAILGNDFPLPLIEAIGDEWRRRENEQKDLKSILLTAKLSSAEFRDALDAADFKKIKSAFAQCKLLNTKGQKGRLRALHKKLIWHQLNRNEQPALHPEAFTDKVLIHFPRRNRWDPMNLEYVPIFDFTEATVHYWHNGSADKTNTFSARCMLNEELEDLNLLIGGMNDCYKAYREFVKNLSRYDILLEEKGGFKANRAPLCEWVIELTSSDEVNDLATPNDSDTWIEPYSTAPPKPVLRRVKRHTEKMLFTTDDINEEERGRQNRFFVLKDKKQWSKVATLYQAALSARDATHKFFDALPSFSDVFEYGDRILSTDGMPDRYDGDFDSADHRLRRVTIIGEPDKVVGTILRRFGTGRFTRFIVRVGEPDNYSERRLLWVHQVEPSVITISEPTEENFRVWTAYFDGRKAEGTTPKEAIDNLIEAEFLDPGDVNLLDRSSLEDAFVRLIADGNISELVEAVLKNKEDPYNCEGDYQYIKRMVQDFRGIAFDALDRVAVLESIANGLPEALESFSAKDADSIAACLQRRFHIPLVIRDGSIYDPTGTVLLCSKQNDGIATLLPESVADLLK